MGFPGHGFCEQVARHHYLLSLSPRTVINVDLPERMSGVRIWMLSGSLVFPGKGEGVLCHGIAKKSACVFKPAMMLEGLCDWRPAWFPVWVRSSIRSSTDLRAVA